MVNPALLLEAPAQAIKKYVGKRASNHRFHQEAINRLLVHYAQLYGHVVRLKVGDPFVFGRGQEELAYVESKGIAVEVIPGISSCIAVPELQHIPLTRRGINESFWVVTATTRKGQLSKDIALAAQSSATVVILMGLRKLGNIVSVFKEKGQSNTPIMVVQDGSTATERCVVGTIETIVGQVQAAELTTPAIIVVGAVVGLHRTFRVAEWVRFAV